MKKKAYYGLDPEPDNSFRFTQPGAPGVTLGTLEEAILSDQRMGISEKRRTMMRLAQEVGHLPKSTPVDSIASRLGGGILGYLIGMYFGLSPVGRVVASVAGYGLGGMMNKFYS